MNLKVLCSHLHVSYCNTSAIANQESLSTLEVEMRKLEGIVKEIVDEMGYLKNREERFADTNRAFFPSSSSFSLSASVNNTLS